LPGRLRVPASQPASTQVMACAQDTVTFLTHRHRSSSRGHGVTRWSGKSSDR
jgi:hypothetical protein